MDVTFSFVCACRPVLVQNMRKTRLKKAKRNKIETDWWILNNYCRTVESFRNSDNSGLNILQCIIGALLLGRAKGVYH